MTPMAAPPPPPPRTDRTPLVEVGKFLVKRDDLYEFAGQRGGKVRTCRALVRRAVELGRPGVITAGSRQSPQVAIVSALARHYGLPCRVHVPTGPDTPQTLEAAANGAEVVRHPYGYNNVIIARARDDAETSGWFEVPFGMETFEAVHQTSAQVSVDVYLKAKRIVVPVGSGMSLAGIVTGLDNMSARAHQAPPPVLGVQVGADPRKRLNLYAPFWRDYAALEKSELDYHAHAPETNLGGIELDPVYEAKCLPFLEPGDLLWVVGIRNTPTPPPKARKQRLVVPQQAAVPPARTPGTPGEVTFKVSAAWASKQLNCTAEGITGDGGCGGECCRTQSYWPPRAGEVPNHCDRLGPDGCTFTPEDRPITCLLYPLKPNKRNTLVVHNKAPMNCCKPNFGEGPKIIDEFRDFLAAVIGDEEADRIRDEVHAGRDAFFHLPPDVAAQYQRELEWEAANVVPLPRSTPLDTPSSGVAS